MIKSHRPSGSSAIQTSAILITVVAVLYLAREIFIPLSFAIVLTFILTPLVAALRKLRLGRAPAVLIVVTVFVTVICGSGWGIFNQLVAVLNELPRYRQNIHNKIEAMRAPGKGALGQAAQSVKELGKELTIAPTPENLPPPPRNSVRAPSNQPVRPQPVQVIPEPVTELQYWRDVTKPFLAPLAELGIVLIFTVFLLIEEIDMRNRLLRLVGLDRLNVVTQALDDATQRVSKYLSMQLLVNASFGTLFGLGLYFIGVPYPALWGTVAAILRVVPYIGAPIAGLFPLVLALAIFDSWRPPVLVFGLIATLELITGNLIEPMLYGAHTGISALALLLSAVFWTVLWGPAGLILSTPLTVCVVVLGRYVPQLSFLHIILGDEPVLSAEAQVYQRLLAMDDQEARAIVDGYLAEHSLLQLYDSVFIPALTMAEQDRHKGDLDAPREEFLFLSIKEMLAEFAGDNVRPADAPPPNFANRILCVPASDEADEITASMLAQVLEQAGCNVISFPLDPSLQQMVEVVEPADSDIIYISSLPPFAFARARSLSRNLRSRYPRTKIVIGVWGFSGDLEKALQRFQASRPDKVVSTLVEALDYAVARDSTALTKALNRQPTDILHTSPAKEQPHDQDQKEQPPNPAADGRATIVVAAAPTEKDQ